MQQESPDNKPEEAALDNAEDVVVPSLAALTGILLTGLLYLVLPPELILGPNWLLLVVEAIFVIPQIIDVLTAWDLPEKARRMMVWVPLGLSTLALILSVIFFSLTLPRIPMLPICYVLLPFCGLSIYWFSLYGIGNSMVEALCGVTSLAIMP